MLISGRGGWTGRPGGGHPPDAAEHSPSYILMASLDLARMQMATEGRSCWGRRSIWPRRRACGSIASPGALPRRRPGRGVGGFRLDYQAHHLGQGDRLTGYAGLRAPEHGVRHPGEMATLNVLVIVSIATARDSTVWSAAGRSGSPRVDRGARVATSPRPPVQETELACSPREA